MLRYIFGLPGTGKTERCLTELIDNEKNKTDDNINYIYIVPEQQSLQAEKNLVEHLENKTAANVQTLSFGRLAYYIFSELGQTKGKYLDDAGKNMLLRKIVSELSGELGFYSKILDKRGFIENLSSTVSEFYRYGFSAEAIKGALPPKASENLSAKLNDLTKIYKLYTEYIKEKYISTDETLDILCSKINESRLLRNAKIWIDGFSGFTPQELKVILRLLNSGCTVTISLTVNEPQIFYQNLKETDFFFETKSTVNKLTKLAGDNFKISQPIMLTKGHRYACFPALEHFGNNFYKYNPKRQDKHTDGIRIIPVGDKYSEISMVADEIINIVREKNYRFKDMAILTGDISGYGKDIRSVFRNYNIPVFVDMKLDILAHPLTEMIRAVVDVVVHNWSYESVFRFLKTGLTGLTRDEIDIFENYVLAYGIKSYKWQLPEWKYGTNNEMFDIDMINSLRERTVLYLDKFTNNLRPDKKMTVRDITVRIFDMLDNLQISVKLEELINTSMVEGENEILRQHTQIWGKICLMFDKMVEILGDEAITVKEYSKILDDGLSGIDMGIIPPSADQITVCDIMRSRLPKIKVLFVIGANEGILPKQVKESGLFSDDERLFLNSLGVELAPDIKQILNQEQFLTYTCLATPTEMLNISYCQGDLTGRNLRPSNIINKIYRLFPSLNEEETEESISLPKPMLSAVCGTLRKIKTGDKISETEKQAYYWFSQNDEFADKIKKFEVLINTGLEKNLSKQTVDLLYGNEINTSVSKLEKYVECPFAYFVEYNLNAKERKLYQVQSMDLGNIFHAVLENFTKRIATQSAKPIESLHEIWEKLTMQRIDSYVDNIVDELAVKVGDEVLLSSARYKYMIERVKQISKRSIWALVEHMKRGSFKPYASELIFDGQSPMTEIRLLINNERALVLSGRIDRVDIMDINGNKYIKIIDYKSGSTKFDINDVYFGMQLQLLLYMDILLKNASILFGAEKIEGEVLPGGVLYFNINDPIIEFKNEVYENLLNSLILKEFKMTGIVLAKEEVITGMDNSYDGKSDIIPVPYGIKALGSNDTASDETDENVLIDESFSLLREQVVNRVRSIGEDITQGNISPFPYKKGSRTGCDYCNYSAICGFGLDENGKRYNIVKKQV